MADVMSRGHGGDGANEPPPGGFGCPKEENEGKSKKKKKKLLPANKTGLVSIPFDRLATYIPVGEACDMFGREEIERDCERSQLKGGIQSVYMKRYRDRKNMAKREFKSLGRRHDNLETIRDTPPRVLVWKIGGRL
ncbi:hypothetical protein Hanom_Chr05g00445701 [Helianthus anomalus]